MKRLLVLIFFLTISCVVMGQTYKSEELIIGRWDLVEVIKDTTVKFEPLVELTTDNPETVEKSNPKNKEVVFFFTGTGEFQERFHGSQFRLSYRFLDKDIVIIGQSTYQILELTAQRLRIQLYEDDDFGSFIKPDISVFKKSRKPFKLIKEYEEHLSRHENGVKKKEGTYHNGYEHGIWQEWHPNGQLKSKRAFINGIPTGTWKTWDEAGKLIEEVKK